ncbi:DUF3114 domain-containing protein [Streptococcus chenjunshii]|uniref:DUF3114 domain-containing protein n=3 Tax=Streptococcus chenjunshii TaxID=2173853 RepID=A0A346NBN2_9STRE|nr:DUF3114 domain-containing protein [Streptococcus chenjunshii]AXQ78427.1 DUF3114 domain-containing protein [Streptococcus chenjunshii]
MSIDMYLGSSQMQAASTEATVEQAMAGLDQLDSAVSGFLDSGSELKGQTYDSARAYVQAVIQPLKEGTRLYLEAVRDSVSRFPEAYQEEVGPEDLRQSDLEDQIAQCDAVIKTGQELLADMQAHPVGQKHEQRISAMKDSLSLVQGARQELQDKLDKLLAFNARSPQIFDGLAELEQALATGRSQTKGAWQADSQTFVIPSDLGWARTIDDLKFAKVYQVSRPEGMSDQDYQVYLRTLHEQAKAFEADGWTQEAVRKGYLSAVAVGYDSRQDIPLSQQLAAFYEEARTFGSGIFQKMWGIDLKKAGEKADKAQTLLQIAMSYSGMPEDDLDGSAEQTQAILAHLSKDLAPDARFWDSFSKAVQVAYPGDNLSSAGGNETLKRQVHQFRYVISAQQAQWVRDNYAGSTDEEKLAAYLSTLEEGNGAGHYSLDESSRLHNKGIWNERQKRLVYPDDSSANYKVTVGFHSEFIIDDKGNFLNEIDPEKEVVDNKNGIVNGASFNYAEVNDDIHKQLDVKAVSLFDPQFRKLETAGYISPNNFTSGLQDSWEDFWFSIRDKGGNGKSWDDSYWNSNGIYSEDGVSAHDRVEKELEDLRKIIEKR